MTKKKKTNVCWEFGLVNATIQMIWKNETKLLVRLNRRQKIKRFRKPERSDVNEALL